MLRPCAPENLVQKPLDFRVALPRVRMTAENAPDRWIFDPPTYI
jgi:hypothetical protein